MYRIHEKKVLNPEVVSMWVDAPGIAKKALPGQFIILRIDEMGERIPLTISDSDNENGRVRIIFQTVGKTTRQLAELNENDCLLDFVGPLGVATHLADVKKVCVVGGGLGNAIAFPQAKSLFAKGVHVDVVAGFRNKEMVILEEEFKANCTNLFLTTDDGSYVRQGFVTNVLQELIDAGNAYDAVIAIGPVVMMKFVCKVTKPYGINTIISMNPIMLDGTGMCGACRLTVGGETKFACVDGPDFDGHKVDFDEAIRRGAMYKDMEKQSLEKHICRLTGGVRNG